MDATTLAYTPSAGSVIKGKINAGNIGAFKASSIGVAPRTVTTQTGNLWLAPSDVLAAIQGDQNLNSLDLTAAGGVMPPVFKASQVAVDASGNFSVDVPAGSDYSLVLLSNDGSEGAVIDEIAVNPGETKTVNIEQADIAATGQVRLSITDLANGQAIESAEVVLLETGESALTSADGSAGFDAIPAGAYSLVIKSAGYITQYETLQVAAGAATDMGILTLSKQKGSASGQIEVTGLNNLANIPVYARSIDGDVFATLTDTSGIFRFNALPVGDGYSFIAIANDFRSSKVENIDIKAGFKASVGVIALTPLAEPVGSITGHAYYSERSGQPEQAGIIVSVEGTDKEGITARDGAFVINGLTAGSYTLNYTDSNHVTQTKTVTVVANAASNMSPVTLQARTGTVNGLIQDDSGNAVANAAVLLKELGLTTVTDSTGNFTFADAPAGEYTLRISKDGYEAKEQYVLVPVDAVNDVDPLVMPAFTFAGSVTLQGATDHAGIIVSLSGVGHTVLTDTNGNYLFSGVAPGNYQLQVAADGYIAQTTNIVIPGTSSSYTLPYNIQLEPKLGVISGFASLEYQFSQAGILVELLGTGYSTYTDGFGNWTMEVPIGNYADGIRFSAMQFSSVTSSDTVTVTDIGQYRAAPVQLDLVEMLVTIPVSVVGSCPGDVQVAFLGLSPNNNTVNTTVDMIAGVPPAVLLPFGDYRMSTTCGAGGFETNTQVITLNKDGATSLTLDAVTIRERYVVVNGGARYVNDPNISLEIGAADAAQMNITDGTNSSGWITFASNTNFTLAAGDSDRTITVNLRDGGGADLSPTSTQVMLDTTITVASFTASGAGTRGEDLTVTIDIGEAGAAITADIPNQVSLLQLNDHGILGDLVADDGIYSRLIKINTAADTDAPVVAHIIDRAGNTLDTGTAGNLVINTAPAIRNLKINSNVASGEMFIQFTTDEDATTNVDYGDSFATLTNNTVISAAATNFHSVTLSGLSAVDPTYLQLNAVDAAGNTSTQQSQGKLAPAAIDTVYAVPGNNEIAVAWPPAMTLRGFTYHVYRSDDDVAYTRLTTDSISASQYLDKTASNGTTYHYKVTVLDESGNESVLSPKASAAPDASLVGPTVISGGIIEGAEVVWLPSLSPYLITTDSLLAARSRLRVLPGASIELSDGVTWDIVGELWVLGDLDNEVVISASDARINGDSAAATVSGCGLNFRPNQKCYGEMSAVINGYPLNGSYMRHTNIGNNSALSISAYYMAVDYMQYVSTSTGDFTVAFMKVSNSNFNGNYEVGFQSAIDSNITLLRPAAFNVNSSVGYGKNLNLNLSHSFGSSALVDSVIHSSAGVSISASLSNDITIDGGSLHFGGDAFLNRITLNGAATFSNRSSSSGAADRVSRSYLGVGNWNDLLNVFSHNNSTADLAALLPIATSADIYNADRDGDFVPDIIDYDNDNDGYSDLQEIMASNLALSVIYDPWDASSHPDPAVTDYDADMDGIPDVDDADNDNDGINNAQELAYGTDPFMRDSDGDGRFDKDELDYTYDPLDRNNFPPSEVVGVQWPQIQTIDSRNLNSNGDVVFLGGEFYLTEFNLPNGTNLFFNLGHNNFHKVEMLGKAFNLNLWPGGAINNNTLYIDEGLLLNLNTDGFSVGAIRSFAEHASFNISSGNATLAQSIVKLSNFGNPATSVGGGSVDGSWVEQSFLATDSIVDSSISRSRIVSDSIGASGSRVISSVLNITGGISTSYYGVNKLAIMDNVLINSSGTSFSINGGAPELIIRNSDIVVPNLSVSYSPTLSAAFDNVGFEFQGLMLDTGFGTPADLLGDGVTDTEITFTNINGVDQTFTVDGLNNPRSTRVFPGGESDLWNPSGVGNY